MSTKEDITLDETINFLNSLIQIDKEAIQKLVNQRVTCNVELANHQTVQVGLNKEGYSVGIIGILNGLFGTNEHGQGPISFIFSDEWELLRVVRTKYPPEQSQ